jgi:hypothetical protein
VGGAIFIIGPSILNLATSLVNANTASVDGGGLNVQPGVTAKIIQSTFRANQAGGAGGGIAGSHLRRIGSGVQVVTARSEGRVVVESAWHPAVVLTGDTFDAVCPHPDVDASPPDLLANKPHDVAMPATVLVAMPSQ